MRKTSTLDAPSLRPKTREAGKRKQATSKIGIPESGTAWIDACKARGILIDPEDWLSEAEIIAIIGVYLAAPMD